MGSASRKSELVDLPEWQTGDDPIAPDGVLVRELDVTQRTEVLAEMMSFDQHGQGEIKLPLNVIAPYITDLILDPFTKKLAFEPADRDYLLTEHPGAASRVLMTAFNLSDLGDAAVARTKGN